MTLFTIPIDKKMYNALLSLFKFFFVLKNILFSLFFKKENFNCTLKSCLSLKKLQRIIAERRPKEELTMKKYDESIVYSMSKSTIVITMIKARAKMKPV